MIARTVIGMPTARRVASSRNRIPSDAVTMSIVFGWPGRVASWA